MKGRILKDKVTYDLPSLDMLDSGLVSGLAWPEKTPYLLFNLSKKDCKRKEPISDPVPGDKYICRVNYLATKNTISAPKWAAVPAALRLEPFKDLEDHKTFEMRVHDKYFAKPYCKYMSAAHEEEGKSYFGELDKTSSVALVRGKKRVGMVTVLRITSTVLPRPLHWVTWLWVDKKLSSDERRCAHALIAGWLKNNSLKYVGASVHAANLRSQKWCLKMGFRPVRVFFKRK